MCPINDLGDGAWDLAPMLVPMSDELILWAPAARALDQSGARWNSKILLTLVREGVVKIAAREAFIESEAFRNKHTWDGLHWLPGYDDEIRRIHREDISNGTRDPRVIIVDDEDGYEWADQQIGANGEKLALARSLYEAGCMPAATRQRIDRNRSSPPNGLWETQAATMAAREILRDARNNEKTRSVLNADLIFRYGDYPVAQFNQISDAVSPARSAEHLTADMIRDLLRWAGSLEYSSDPKVLSALRDDKITRGHFWSIMHGCTHPLLALEDKIKDGFDDKKLLPSLYGDKIGRSAGLSSVITSIISLGMTDNLFNTTSGTATLIGAAATSIPIIRATVKQITGEPAEPYTGPIWPFMLAYKTKNPTRDQINRIIKFIEDEMRRINE